MRNEIMQNMCKKCVIVGVIIAPILLLSILAVVNISVEVDIWSNQKSSDSKPYGPIRTESPYQNCFSLQDRSFDKEEVSSEKISIQPYMATYQQVIDQDYLFQIFAGKILINEKLLSGSDLSDNSYVNMGSVDSKQIENGDICIVIRPRSENPINPLTIWLDSQNQPIVKFTQQKSIWNSLFSVEKYSGFQLGKNTIYGLFLAYVLALLAFIVLILYGSHWKEENCSDTSAHKRVGHK